MNWIALTNNKQLEELIVNSSDKPALIFKHSTRCGISRMVLKNFEREFDLSVNEIDAYYLDLLNYRDISNDISSKFNIIHQSPQLVVIKGGEVIHHGSHSDINAGDLKEIVLP
jgi:bacillithiol system protein YtxJ